MKLGVQVAVLPVVALVLLSGTLVAAPKVTFQLPPEVRPDQTPLLPITFTVTGADGKPFSGKVDLWANSGTFAKEDGNPLSDRPLSVEVRKGVGHAMLSFGGEEAWPSPLILSASMGPYSPMVALGQAEAKIRYQETIEVSTPVPAATADGAASPIVRVVIKDQFGQPMDGVPVTARFGLPGEHAEAVGKTGRAGVADIKLGPSTRSGYALGQILSSRLAS